MDEKKILSAVQNEDFADFEDGLQEECAVEAMADYIVTRNPADFKKARVKVLEPSAFVEMLKDI